MNEYDFDQKNSNNENNENNENNGSIGINDSINEVVGTESLRTATFYSENLNKPDKKKSSGVLQLIVVAVVSSILGGGLVAAMLMFVAPSVQSNVKSYFGTAIPMKTSSTQNVQGLTKVEIQKSESPVTAIAEKVGPSVVGIKVTIPTQESFFGPASAGTGEGSGIIISADGFIMTNNHVISEAIDPKSGKLMESAKIEVYLPSDSGQTKPFPAKVIGKDAKTDLAVIKIDASGLPAAELGNSEKLKVGEMAVAIGNPGGLEYMGSVTVGVISGLNRTISIEDNGNLKLIQTDAAINPGNSGGALVNSQGQVIGVNSAKVSADGFDGMGFAIPINQAKEITDSLITTGYVKGRPLLGVSIDQTFDSAAAKQNNVPVGCYVASVSPLSGAEKAGIKAKDIIIKIDGNTVSTFSELEKLKNKHKPGEVVKIEVYRYSDKANHTFNVTLGENKG